MLTLGTAVVAAFLGALAGPLTTSPLGLSASEVTSAIRSCTGVADPLLVLVRRTADVRMPVEYVRLAAAGSVLCTGAPDPLLVLVRRTSDVRLRPEYVRLAAAGDVGTVLRKVSDLFEVPEPLRSRARPNVTMVSRGGAISRVCTTGTPDVELQPTTGVPTLLACVKRVPDDNAPTLPSLMVKLTQETGVMNARLLGGETCPPTGIRTSAPNVSTGGVAAPDERAGLSAGAGPPRLFRERAEDWRELRLPLEPPRVLSLSRERGDCWPKFHACDRGEGSEDSGARMRMAWTKLLVVAWGVALALEELGGSVESEMAVSSLWRAVEAIPETLAAPLVCGGIGDSTRKSSVSESTGVSIPAGSNSSGDESNR